MEHWEPFARYAELLTGLICAGKNSYCEFMCTTATSCPLDSTSQFSSSSSSFFLPLRPKRSLSLARGCWCRCLLYDWLFRIAYSQYFEQYCVSTLTPTHCDKKILWPRRQQHRSIDTHIEGSLITWPLRKTTSIGSHLGLYLPHVYRTRHEFSPVERALSLIKRTVTYACKQSWDYHINGNLLSVRSVL